MDLELSEQARADTDDHGQHQNLDAGGHHVAQDLFGEERGLVPEREWHQHESGERGQLELDQRDEQLDRQHEERSEEHTSELQSLMRNTYADFCFKKKKS